MMKSMSALRTQRAIGALRVLKTRSEKSLLGQIRSASARRDRLTDKLEQIERERFCFTPAIAKGRLVGARSRASLSQLEGVRTRSQREVREALGELGKQQQQLLNQWQSTRVTLDNLNQKKEEIEQRILTQREGDELEEQVELVLGSQPVGGQSYSTSNILSKSSWLNRQADTSQTALLSSQPDNESRTIEHTLLGGQITVSVTEVTGSPLQIDLQAVEQVSPVRLKEAEQAALERIKKRGLRVSQVRSRKHRTTREFNDE